MGYGSPAPHGCEEIDQKDDWDALLVPGKVSATLLPISPSSSVFTKDGIVRWTTTINGVSTVQFGKTDAIVSPEAIDRMQLLTTFNSIQTDQTEYTWDYVCWERPWVGTVPPPQGSSAPSFVSATSTSITFNVPIPTPAPDSLTFLAGGTGVASGVYGYQDSTAISGALPINPAWAGTTQAFTVTGLTPSTTYKGVCYTLAKGSVSGLQSAGLATAATTA